MKKDLPKLELQKVLLQDAQEIITARSRALLIHKTRDINAAGDEVEKVVREIIKRKLATKYYIGHGHILDHELSTSPQFDVIIADNAGAPILFKTENETEYFPYESIYAIGEIKSSYYKSKNYIEDFCSKIGKIKSELRREETPIGYTGDLIFENTTATHTRNHPHASPLFSFMFFVDANDFDVSQVKDLYKSQPPSHLPNVICLLNKGIIVNTNVTHFEGKTKISYNYAHQFNEAAGLEETSHWVFLPFSAGNNDSGVNLGFLIFLLSSHLKRCTLMQPDLFKYLNRFFVPDNGEGIFI